MPYAKDRRKAEKVVPQVSDSDRFRGSQSVSLCTCMEEHSSSQIIALWTMTCNGGTNKSIQDCFDNKICPKRSGAALSPAEFTMQQKERQYLCPQAACMFMSGRLNQPPPSSLACPPGALRGTRAHPNAHGHCGTCHIGCKRTVYRNKFRPRQVCMGAGAH